METLGILQEIESLVSDKLEVVSYKWLSRNFLVSSNVAKRLLQEFAEKHKSGLEVVYALSGWLKNNPQNYHIRLVLGSELEEAKKEFDGSCSVHVYSVQAAIPKDSAALWNDEFVQTEELFKQPSAVDNCLRDNRFCGILNPFAKRNVAEIPINNATPQPKSAGISGPVKNRSVPEIIKSPPLQNKVEQSGPVTSKQSIILVKDIKSESPGTEDQYPNPAIHGEKISFMPSNEKKGQGDKSSSSLASLWGRASGKSKLTSAEKNHSSKPTASAEAQICAGEAIEDQSSDDEARNVKVKLISNGEGAKKRRVILDYSDDEYEDTISLASPDPPIRTSFSKKPNTNGHNEYKLEVKEEKSSNQAPDKFLGENSSVSSKSINSKDSSKEKLHNHITGDYNKADTVSNAASNSPKRRKVLRTHIDERGREVNEVVWEGEDTEMNKTNNGATETAGSNAIKAEDNTIINTVTNRAPAVAAKKSPAAGNVFPNQGNKAGNKKGALKDPKQGNILSFFKRV